MKLLWKIIAVLTLALVVSIPLILVWTTASERFPYSKKLYFQSFYPYLNETDMNKTVIYINFTDSGKLIASLKAEISLPPPNSDNAQLHLSIERPGEIALDSITLDFTKEARVPISVNASSSIPPDKFSIPPHNFSGNQGGRYVVSANYLGNYGLGNTTLDFVLNLPPPESQNYYDVFFILSLSMHERTIIQLTSLKGETDQLLLFTFR